MCHPHPRLYLHKKFREPSAVCRNHRKMHRRASEQLASLRGAGGDGKLGLRTASSLRPTKSSRYGRIKPTVSQDSEESTLDDAIRRRRQKRIHW